jgi:LysR family transcriptional regulator, hypochlorite-specific transcription factor HypT
VCGDGAGDANADYALHDASKALPMTLNLSWLEDFQALADSGNFSRAAEQRHMTQPAFGRRIKALEAWLGTPLFDRSGHPVTLTEAGQWLRGMAQQMLERAARLPDEARAVADGSASTLRFAATHALSLSFLPPWLRGLEARTAVGPIQLVSDVAAHCEALLRQARVQFLLCHAHEHAPAGLDPQAFESCEVGQDELLPVSAPQGRGRPRYSLDGSAARVPMLAYSAESGIGRVLRALHAGALEAAGTETVFTAHLATVLRSLALESRGVAFLPASLVADDLAAGRLVPAGGARWRIPLSIRLFRGRAPMVPLAETFWAAAAAAPPAPAKPKPRPPRPPRPRTPETDLQ